MGTWSKCWDLVNTWTICRLSLGETPSGCHPWRVLETSKPMMRGTTGFFRGNNGKYLEQLRKPAQSPTSIPRIFPSKSPKITLHCLAVTSHNFIATFPMVILSRHGHGKSQMKPRNPIVEHPFWIFLVYPSSYPRKKKHTYIYMYTYNLL